MRRVLVTEDSAVARQLLVGILNADPELTVVGEATNGEQAVRMAAELTPDVITMDVHMPVLDGLEATRRIMAATPTPIVVVSADDPNDVRTSFGALEAGALSVLGKPRGPSSPDFAERARELSSTVKAMSEMRVVRRRRRAEGNPTRADGRSPAPVVAAPAAPAAGAAPAPALRPSVPPPAGARPMVDAAAWARRVDAIAIGCSTGGPAALAAILAALPGGAPVPILIVQHITRGFDRGLVDWLNGITPLDVRLAHHGDPLRAGEIIIAPCDQHLSVSPLDRTVVLRDEGPVDGHQPSASVLFRSVGQTFRRHALGIILTGMGEDGAAGLADLKAAGGSTVGQDQATSVVYGMPAAAAARGAVDRVAALDEVAGIMVEAWSRGRVLSAA